MKKSQQEVILIIILLMIFLKLISPQITEFAEKSRTIKAKMFLRTLLAAEAAYYSMWSEYTDNIELLSKEIPEILKWKDSLDWSFNLECDKEMFKFTLTRLGDNPIYAGKTLTVDQTGKISGDHRYK